MESSNEIKYMDVEFEYKQFVEDLYIFYSSWDNFLTI